MLPRNQNHLNLITYIIFQPRTQSNPLPAIRTKGDDKKARSEKDSPAPFEEDKGNEEVLVIVSRGSQVDFVENEKNVENECISEGLIGPSGDHHVKTPPPAQQSDQEQDQQEMRNGKVNYDNDFQDVVDKHQPSPSASPDIDVVDGEQAYLLESFENPEPDLIQFNLQSGNISPAESEQAESETSASQKIPETDTPQTEKPETPRPQTEKPETPRPQSQTEKPETPQTEKSASRPGTKSNISPVPQNEVDSEKEEELEDYAETREGFTMCPSMACTVFFSCCMP